MAENTAIEWADHTFNPWVGCTKISRGCDGCYAEAWAKRAGKAAGVVWGGERRRTSAANWQQPLRWNAQAEREGRRFRVFCASLADVFDNQVPDAWREDLFELIRATPHLDWLLLTKRIGNAGEMIRKAIENFDIGYVPAFTTWPWPNVWIGATVVDQAEADRDVPKLLATPARVRFLSIEPMLGPIDLSTHCGAKALPLYWEGTDADGLIPSYCAATGRHLGDFKRRGWVKTSENMSPWIDWVIAGGESGPCARPMHPDWARSLRNQCAAAGVPFLFKQWGEFLPVNADEADPCVADVADSRLYWSDGSKWDRFDGQRGGVDMVARVGKKAAGRQLDGRTHNGFPA